MKLLILTQKVDINDDVLGFMHAWIAEFAKACERVIVICLEKGEVNLPDNVKVLSLGKERGHSKVQYIWNFYQYIWLEHKNYDQVFVHMNQEYVVLGTVPWKMWGKKISLWYAHGATSWSLKIAEKLSDIIFTSTKSGFRIKSDKVKVVGQGIDINRFRPETEKRQCSVFKIITVGRISPVKDYETLIEAVEILIRGGVKLRTDIVGGVGLPEQKKYLASLKKIVAEKRLVNVINFVGAVSNSNIVGHLQSADLFVNMSHTGSLDKAVLEAMACGLPVLTCNEALIGILGEYKEMLIYDKGDYEELAERIKLFINMDKTEEAKVKADLREIVVKSHSLEGLIKKFNIFLLAL